MKDPVKEYNKVIAIHNKAVALQKFLYNEGILHDGKCDCDIITAFDCIFSTINAKLNEYTNNINEEV